MKIGDRLRCRVEGECWSGTIANIFDDDGDEIEEVDPAIDVYTLVIWLDEPLPEGEWLTFGPLEAGQISRARLN